MSPSFASAVESAGSVHAPPAPLPVLATELLEATVEASVPVVTDDAMEVAPPAPDAFDDVPLDVATLEDADDALAPPALETLAVVEAVEVLEATVPLAMVDAPPLAWSAKSMLSRLHAAKLAATTIAADIHDRARIARSSSHGARAAQNANRRGAAASAA